MIATPSISAVNVVIFAADRGVQETSVTGAEGASERRVLFDPCGGRHA